MAVMEIASCIVTAKDETSILLSDLPLSFHAPEVLEAMHVGGAFQKAETLLRV